MTDAGTLSITLLSRKNTEAVSARQGYVVTVVYVQKRDRKDFLMQERGSLFIENVNLLIDTLEDINASLNN